MDRLLISKIIGKENAVDLNDEIYNLREITEMLRGVIVFKMPIDEKLIARTSVALNNINNVITKIKDNLESDSSTTYTNSRAYLTKFLNNICINIQGIRESFEPFNNEKFIYHTNTLIDLVLMY